MKSLLTHFARFLADEQGPTAVEYAAMTMLVLLACLVAVTSMAQSAGESLGNSSDSIEQAISAHP